MNPKAEVKIIDPYNMLYGQIGELIEIRAGGQALVYFAELGCQETFNRRQIEYLPGDVVKIDGICPNGHAATQGGTCSTDGCVYSSTGK